MLIEVTKYVAGHEQAGTDPDGQQMELDPQTGRWHAATCGQLDNPELDCHCWGTVQAGE